MLCLLAAFVGITTIGHNVTFAEDRSTSITCTGVGPCEKTDCINGDCQTTTTNSSNISTIHEPRSNTGSNHGSNDGSGSSEKNKDPRNSIIEDRLKMLGR